MAKKTQHYDGLATARSRDSTVASDANQEAGVAVMDAVTRSTKAGDELKAELDELLDEIDGVLEVNAEDFVRSYIQKGGQ